MVDNKNSQGGPGSSQGKSNGGRGDTSKRGFASMDAAKQREIASKGGKASHGNRPKESDSSKR